ncbi:hypothetical protein S7711_06980 [Stachybotrys chartarum IBT 7711]|uniref:DNA topoisomerase (ATP-hydrolyzing) n=1 Tax=Stachybotrys chartarum (strain CBS 109288 / IBT 7711) TaxID=1280523 RepID=A0A084ARZ1_STACB|nr:hypothetical protein S7711_06980 [Stachybotrys chartarum IBT 7711]
MPARARRLRATETQHSLELDPELAVQPSAAGAVITRIEDIMEAVVDGITEAKEVRIELKSAKNIHRRVGRDPSRFRDYVRFPGCNVQEARKFARVVLILQLSHDALVSGTVLTKRHIYYQHQELFEKQRTVDELVENIAFTLGVCRDDLNIAAMAKGIMILVVEKEAVFRSLSSTHFWQTSLHGPGLIVTAKGYPDMITLSFLRLAQERCPQLPMLALVDFDPDGMNIYRCYRYGAAQLQQEASERPLRLRLLGVTASQILNPTRPIPGSVSQTEEASQSSQSSSQRDILKTSISSTACRDPITRLTARDRKLAINTLTKLDQLTLKDDEATELTREIQIMLMMGTKAEIQWLDESGNISNWLDAQMGNMMQRTEDTL